MLISLRPTEDSDLPLIYAWEQNPLINAGFYSSRDDLTWERHWEYWHKDVVAWQKFMIMLDDRPVGECKIAHLSSWCPEIGYQIGEVSLWGKGIGKEAVRLMLEWLRGRGYEYCHTTILDKNERSIGLIESLGFENRGKAREGETWWQKKL